MWFTEHSFRFICIIHKSIMKSLVVTFIQIIREICFIKIIQMQVYKKLNIFPTLNLLIIKEICNKYPF